MCDITIKKYVLYYSWFNIAIFFRTRKSFLPFFILCNWKFSHERNVQIEIPCLFVHLESFYFRLKDKEIVLFFCHLAKIPLDLLLGTAHTINIWNIKKNPFVNPQIDKTGDIYGLLFWVGVTWNWFISLGQHTI